MKRIFWIFIVLCGLVGCTRSEVQGEGDSYVTVSAVADPSLNIKQAKASGYTIPLPDDYSYTVRHTGDQSEVAQGASTAGLGTLALMAGNYLFEVASVGEVSADMPSYAGSATFSVKKGATTKVEVKAKLTSAVVEVHFSDAVKAGFESYEAAISAKGVTQTAVFDQTTPEGKLVYFPTPATEVTCTIKVTSKQGLSFSTTQTVEALAAADLLSWRIDVPAYEEKPTEPLVLELVLDKTLNEEVKRFTVGLTQMATGLPTITGRQIDVAQPIGVKRAVGSDVRLDLSTKAGLDKVLLLFRFGQEPLQGRPVQGVLDFLSLSEQERSDWGVALVEGGVRGATNTLIDLTAMTAKMPGPESGAQNYCMSVGLLDLNGQYTVRELTFNVYGVSVTTIDHTYDLKQPVDWQGLGGLVNGTYAVLKGRYNVDDAPDGLTFRYRQQGTDVWRNVAAEYNTDTKQVWATVGVLPNAWVYEYELFAGGDNGGVKNLTSFRGPQIENMNLEEWGGSSNNPSGPWSSPNNALGSNTGRDTGWNGTGFSAKMETKDILGNFASGGLFTGSMVVNTSMPYKSSRVGAEFSQRPKKLRLYVKYQNATIRTVANSSFVGNGAKSGDPDMCEVAVKFEKWGTGGDYKVRWRDGFFGEPDPSTYFEGRTAQVKGYDGNGGTTFDSDIRTKLSVGYGQWTSRGQNEWEMIEIDITYYQDEMPDHVIITAVSSAWGGYMSGGLGSTLWVDDLEFVY